MSETPAVLPTPSRMREGFTEIYAGALHRNTLYERFIAGLIVVILALGVMLYRTNERANAVQVAFIRMDDLGRHDLVRYDQVSAGQPREHELRTDIKDFAVKHLSRLRSVISQDFSDSLFYLDRVLQDEAQRVTFPQDIQPFLKDRALDEVEINIRDVKITQLEQPPYRAEVAFDKVFYQTGTRQMRRDPEPWTMHLVFDLRVPTSREYLSVNPRGLRITNKRVERAYTAPQQTAKQ